MAVTYLVGDATRPIGSQPAIICHVCNNIGLWGAGFVLALSRRWKKPERAYRHLAQQYAGSTIPLGLSQLVPVEEEQARQIYVMNMVAQIAPGSRPHPLMYDSLKDCLRDTAVEAARLGADLHMPRLGAGLAGGDWRTIEQIISTAAVDGGVSAFVYTLPAVPHTL